MGFRKQIGLAVVLAVVLGTVQTASAVLMAHYTFDDGSNLGADSAGNHTAIQYGTDSSSSTDAVVGGGSLALDGTGLGLYVEAVPSEDFVSLTSFTIAAFVKPDLDHVNWTDGQVGRIFGSLGIDENDNQFGENAGYGFGVRKDGNLRYTTFGIQDYDQAATVQDDQWQQIAVVVDEGDATFYLDGKNLGTITGGDPATSTQNWFHIGAAGYHSSDRFVGLIDDLQVYDSTLTDAEIIDLLPPGPRLTVDRSTGSATLTNDGLPVTITDYAMTSAVGALDGDAWLSLADNDSSWTETSTTPYELAEETTGSKVLGTGASINLGEPWIKNTSEDISMTLTLADTTTLSPIVLYTGAAGTSLALGDFDGNGSIDSDDWAIYQAGMRVDLTGLSEAQAYQKGDLDNDGDNDLADFGIFRDVYVAENGEAAFANMVAGVPEPNSAILLILGPAILLFMSRSRPWLRNVPRCASVAILALTSVLLMGVSVQAELDPVFEFSFPASYNGTGTTVTDLSGAGNHVTLDGADAALVDDRPAGFGGSLMSLTGSNGGHGITGAIDLLNNTAVGAAGGFMMDVWFTWDGVYGAGAGPRKLIDYAGTESLRVANSQIQFLLSNGGTVIGMDIVADQWYHAVGVFDTEGNDPYEDTAYPGDYSIDGRAYLYIDDNLVNSGGTVATKTGFGDSLDRPMAINRWPGTGGGDWYQGSIFNPSVYFGFEEPLAPTLTLEVNTTTGAVTMRNDSGEDIDINAYEILSDGDVLNASGWNPIQGEDGFPAGTGDGEGWETSGTPDSGFLGESWLTGDSTFADGREFDLGMALNPGAFVEPGDIEFTIRRAPDGRLIEGMVSYTTSPGLPGDFNGNGQVEQGDLDLVLLNWGQAGTPDGWVSFPPTGTIGSTELTAVRGNWGNTASATTAAVPEPTSLLLLGMAGLLGLASVRRRSGR